MTHTIHADKVCQHIPMSQSAVGHVSLCPECRVVHISLQYFSIRFEIEAFEELAHMLSTAQQNLPDLHTCESNTCSTNSTWPINIHH